MDKRKKIGIIVSLSIILILFICLSNRIIGGILNIVDKSKISIINCDEIYDGATQELDYYVDNYYVENDLLEQISFYGWIKFKDIKTELDDSTKIILKGKKHAYSVSMTDYEKKGAHAFGTRVSLLKIEEDIYSISLMLSNGEQYGIVDTEYYLGKENGAIKLVKGLTNLNESNDRAYRLGTLLNFSKTAEYAGNKYSVSGLSLAEASGSWTHTNVVDLFFEIEDELNEDLVLFMEYAIYGKSQRVKLLANGNEIANYVSRKSECKEIVIPREYVENNELLLRLELPNASLPENGDPRELALYIKNLKLSTEFSEIPVVDAYEENRYNLGTELSFMKETSSGNKYALSGISPAENSGSWTYAKEAELLFVIEEEITKDLVLLMDYSTYGKTQEVVITVNGYEVANYVAQKGESKEIVIPKEYIENNELFLQIALPNATRPENGDKRELGLLIKNMKLSTEFSEIPVVDAYEENRYNLGTELSFMKETSSGNKYALSGISPAENSGSWTYAKEAELLFVIEEEITKDLVLLMDYSTYGKTQEVVITVNGYEVANYVAQKGESKEIVIPKEYIEGKEMLIRFSFPEASKPSNGDKRELALSFKRMILK